MSPVPMGVRLDRVEDDVVAVRERIVRVETTLGANEKAAEQRHQELKVLLELVKQRQDATEARSWKLALGLVALGVASGTGAAQLLRGFFGG